MPTQETIPCPQCGQATEVELWQVLDLARQPELRRRFLQGEINALRCGNCGTNGMLPAPLAIHDPAGEQVIFFIPDDPQITPEIMGQIQADLGNALMRDWRGNYSDYLFRPTLARNPMELVQMLAAVKMTGSEENNAERAIQHLYETICAFIQAETWNDTQHVVENHSELLSDAAGLMLIQMIEAARQEGDEDIKAIFVDHLALLRHCREIGIEAAFAEKFGGNSAEGENILPEIERHFEALTSEQRQTFFEMAQEFSQLHQPSDMTRRVELSHQMLQMINRTDNTQFWAALQHGLGSDFAQNLQGNRADNLEQAIYHFEQALTAINRVTMPVEWATTMMNLANAYSNRIRGDRAENIELAIDAYQQALQVRTRQDMPVQWATTMMNLASAYSGRIRGERADNIEKAIDAYQQALEVRTRQAMPVEWAEVTTNLAIAYYARTSFLAEGERADNIEQAIDAYQQALEVRTRQAMPVEWANTMMNLANAYYSRTPLLAEGERADNIEQAIKAYQQVLQVVTRQAMPVEWAQAMNNLSNAYYSRTPFLVEGERADNIEQAIDAYQQALKEQSLEQLPADHRQTQRNLGHLYFGEQRWAEAETAYREAIEAGQLLLAVAVTDVGRRAEVAETAQLFARSAYCQLQQGQPLEALLTLEQGKTRLLTEALALSGANLALLPAGQQQAYQDAVDRVRSLEAELRLPPREELTDFEKPVSSARNVIAELSQARSDLNGLIDTIRQDQPDFMPTGLELEQLLALIPPGGALVAPLITSQGSAVFVLPDGAAENVIARREAATQSPAADGETASRPPVARSDMEYVVWLNEFTEADLRETLQGPADDPKWGGWLGAYFDFLRDSQANRDRWFAAIEQTNGLLGEKLVAPIVKKLTGLGVNPGAPLLLMPQGGLGLLPLHAASPSPPTPLPHTGEGSRALLDDYVISYAPSGYALHAARQRLNSPLSRNWERGPGGEGNLFAIVNPTGDLPFTPAEGDAIAALFQPGQVTRLDKDAATLEAVGGQLQPAACRWLHFSGHGFYNWREAMQSGLVLADGNLTLARLISQADLSRVRLVTLSACETGITDITQSPDEFLGLPAGLMQAGAPAVVSTLWAVNDLSTMLLMERFYRHYLEDGLALPDALRQAQRWLRDVTAGELAERFAAAQEALLEPAQRLPAGVAIDGSRRFRYDYEPDDRPFAHPFYWAAFTFSGWGEGER